MDASSALASATLAVQFTQEIQTTFDNALEVFSQAKFRSRQDISQAENGKKILEKLQALRNDVFQTLPQISLALPLCDQVVLEETFNILAVQADRVCHNFQERLVLDIQRPQKLRRWQWYRHWRSTRNSKRAISEGELAMLSNNLSVFAIMVKSIQSYFSILKIPQPLERFFEDRPLSTRIEMHMSDPYEARHYRYSKLRLRGTCDWFLDTAEFKKWHMSENAEFLWVQGCSGSGKSIIMSRVVDYLQSLRNINYGWIYAFHYMAPGQAQHSKDLQASIDRQLELANACHVKQNDSHSVSIAHHSKSSVVQLSDPSSTKILIDAWDNRNMDDPKGFNEILDAWRATGHSLLIFSQSDPTSEPASIHREWTTVRLTAETNRKDIVSLADNLLEANVSFKAWWDQEAERDLKVKDRFADRSKGNFFLCELHVEHLLAQSTLLGFTAHIEAIEAKDDPTYVINWALGMLLSRQAEDSAKIARRILVWLSITSQPLNIKGLCESLSLVKTNGCAKEGPVCNLDPSKMPTAETVLASCKGFVRTVPGLESICFANDGIATHIASEWQDDRVAEDKILGDVCLQYLLLDDFRGGPCEKQSDLVKRLRSRPFLKFASCNWIHHCISVQLLPPSVERSKAGRSGGGFCEPNAPGLERIHALMLEFLSSREHCLSALQAMMWGDMHHNQQFSEDYKKTCELSSDSFLRMAAAFGLNQCFEILLDPDTQCYGQSDNNSKPLLSFDVKGLFILLAHCLFPTTEPGFLGSETTCMVLTKDDPIRKLHFSSIRSALGEELILHLLWSETTLLEKHAGDFLQAAVHAQNTNVVQKLLLLARRIWKFDSDVWKQPVMTACEKGYDQMLILLLQYTSVTWFTQRTQSGGKHDSCHSPYVETITQTPLQVACSHGHTDVVKILLRHGAYLESPSGSKEKSPLMQAVEQRLENIVMMLLHAGAKVANDPEQTPLHVAVQKKDLRILKLLLASVADVHLKDVNGREATAFADSDPRILALFSRFDYQ